MLNFIRSMINQCIDTGERNYIIAPFGHWGKETKRILNDEYNIVEAFCVDNNCFDNKNVFSTKQMPKIGENYIVLIVTENEYFRYQLVEVFSKLIRRERIKSCILYHENQMDVFNDPLKVKLDFLCVGFAKCGTTSMQAALSQHPKIYLPREKETFFIKNINEETHYKLKDSYPPEKVKNKIVGGIEPKYYMNAESVYRYFGSELKIIMCVANPIKALYSRFKMAMRDIGNEELEYLKKFGKVTPELFDVWICGKLDLYCYMDYIKFYLNFFKRSQIKVIVSELLYSFPKEHMDELQDFLGIESTDKLCYNEFPHVNKGTQVARSYAAACVNKKIWGLIRETKDLDTEMEIRKMRHEIFEVTTEQYTRPMLDTTRERLLQYYKASINELEDFLNMSFEGVWYE